MGSECGWEERVIWRPVATPKEEVKKKKSSLRLKLKVSSSLELQNKTLTLWDSACP